VLAYEATKVTHGAAAAQGAWRASMGAFHSRTVEADMFPSSTIPRIAPASDTSAIPRHQLSRKDLEAGTFISSICAKSGLTQSVSEARRLIEQGGIYINDRQIKSVDEKIILADFNDEGEARIRKGKKKYLILEIQH
jgi:tyrosyl-tRNA synthetase